MNGHIIHICNIGTTIEILKKKKNFIYYFKLKKLKDKNGVKFVFLRIAHIYLKTNKKKLEMIGWLQKSSTDGKIAKQAQ